MWNPTAAWDTGASQSNFTDTQPALSIAKLTIKLSGEDQPGGVCEWVTNRMERLVYIKNIALRQGPVKYDLSTRPVFHHFG